MKDSESGGYMGILQIPDGHRRDNDDNLSIIILRKPAGKLASCYLRTK